jgi:hypothetical protein
LLNQGDSISVKCIVEGGADKPEVEGRIVGVHEIEWSILADQKSARENFLMGSGAAVGFVAAVALQFLPVGRGIHGLTRLLAPVMGLAMGAGIGQFIHNWITVLEAWSRWVRQLK